MLLSVLYKKFEAEKRILGFSDYTFKAYKIQMNLLIKHFGDKDIHEISLGDLKAYLGKASEKLKPSSLGHRVRFIRSIFRFAFEEGYTSTFIASKLKEPKTGPRIPRYIIEEDIELIRESCKTPRERALINLLYSTGCRIGEIYRMDRNQIDWEKRSIVVLGKGDKEREVYFDIKTRIWLKRYLNSRSDEDSALFVSERRPIVRSTIHQLRYTVKRIAKRSGVEVRIYPHRFRHSFCTHLLNRGAPMEMISSLAGHTKISTTQIYASLSGEKRREFYNKYF
jgi:integrase/recombinase XerD